MALNLKVGRGLCLLLSVAAGVAAAETPCSLLTVQEVAAVVGTPVVGAKLADIGQPACMYSLKTGKVYLYQIPDGRSGFIAGKKFQDTKSQAVAGVGDDAYWSPLVNTLNILRGDTYLMIQFVGVKNGSLDTAKALAAKVLLRL